MSLERAMRELREKLDGADYDVMVMVKGVDGSYRILDKDNVEGSLHDIGFGLMEELMAPPPHIFEVRVVKAYNAKLTRREDVSVADAIPSRSHPWERHRGERICSPSAKQKRIGRGRPIVRN